MNNGVEEQAVSDDLEIKKIVGQIAAAYFGNSHVSPAEINTVINQIANSLAGVGAPAPEPSAQEPEEKTLTPAQIRKSITRDAIISFEDNKPYKTMRRHLASRGLTPEQYRSKWGLPRDYPMVAPGYSETRSNLAKERGLGARGRPGLAAEPSPQRPAPAEAIPAAAEPAAAMPASPAPAKEGAAAPVAEQKPRSGRRNRATAAAAAPARSIRAAKKAPASAGRGEKRGPGRSGGTKSASEKPGSSD